MRFERLCCVDGALGHRRTAGDRLRCRVVTGERSRLSSSLSAEVTSAVADARLTFTVTNTSDEALWLLEWNTPLEGLLGDVLRVTCDGRRLEYRGKMVKRGGAPLDAWRHLPAGASVTARFELGDAYDGGDCRQLDVSVDTLAQVRSTPPDAEGDIDFVDLTTEPIRLIGRP